MPKAVPPDDAGVPMHVMQAQRIRVLQAQLAEAKALVEKLTQENAALRRGVNPDDRDAMAAMAVPAKRKTRRYTYTPELLMSVWQAWSAGRPIEQVAEIFGADVAMMKLFVAGDYWTEAAQEAYDRLGVRRKPKGAESRKD